MGCCFSVFGHPRRASDVNGRHDAAANSRDELLRNDDLSSGLLQPPQRHDETVDDDDQTIMSHQNHGELQDLEELIRKGLQGSIKNSTQLSETEIVLPASVREVWNRLQSRNFYTRRSWYDSAWDESDMMNDYLIIMSILVHARIQCWEQFRKIFIDPQRNDDGLPYARDVLMSDDFLGPSQGRDFYERQWMYCPLMIKQQEEPRVLTGMEFERRFPFIEQEKEIGHGATGTVFKQIVAAQSLEYQNPSAVNHRQKTIACKRVQDNQIETVEFENLQSLRGLLATHDRIMVNIATIIKDEPKAGKVHYILYDLAAYDLKQFLTQVPNSHDEEHRRRSDTAVRGRNGSEHWNEADLIRESQNLAHALDFLHHRLYSDKRVTMTHNDLKPENILIFYPDAPGGKKYPVGQWKIADFGLAKIKDQKLSENRAIRVHEKAHRSTLSPDRVKQHPGELVDLTHRSVRSNSAVLIRSTSPSVTKSKRDPGRWTAPEILGQGENQPNPRSGDIWSFGCVLADVLAFAVHPALVSELLLECEMPLRMDQRFYDVDTKKVKDSVASWLKTLHEKKECEGKATGKQWVKDVATLILQNILLTETQCRSKAGEIRDQLGEIRLAMETPRVRHPSRTGSGKMPFWSEVRQWESSGQHSTSSEIVESPKHDIRFNIGDADAINSSSVQKTRSLGS